MRIEGQKKTFDKVKASLKQAVHIPSDYTGLSTQIQLFGAACNIFFGEDSICTTSMRQLLLIVNRQKKSFCDQIALEDFFVAKFLFALDMRVQRWLLSCKQAVNSCTEVNDRVLNFKDLINDVLNSTFNLSLPPAFKKVNASNDYSATEVAEQSKNKEGRRGGGNKRKKKDGDGNMVKNMGQHGDFKLAAGESWKRTFANLLPKG
jgi:hypothetical protein